MQMLESGADPRRIADEWREKLGAFGRVRQQYLLYP
jgi:hypothetical protein